jgi:hypothetical protein
MMDDKAVYAFALREGALAYTITDVLDLHEWMVKHFAAHPLFERVPIEELKDDPCIDVTSLTPFIHSIIGKLMPPILSPSCHVCVVSFRVCVFIIKVMTNKTDEGMKVTRQGGSKYPAIFRRIAAGTKKTPPAAPTPPTNPLPILTPTSTSRYYVP